MDTFSPEFSQYWQQEAGTASANSIAMKRDDDTFAQQVALEELVERVTAARSVV